MMMNVPRGIILRWLREARWIELWFEYRTAAQKVSGVRPEPISTDRGIRMFVAEALAVYGRIQINYLQVETMKRRRGMPITVDAEEPSEPKPMAGIVELFEPVQVHLPNQLTLPIHVVYL